MLVALTHVYYSNTNPKLSLKIFNKLFIKPTVLLPADFLYIVISFLFHIKQHNPQYNK